MKCNNCGKWAGAYAGFAKDHDLCTCPQKKEWVHLTVEERETLRDAYQDNCSGLISAVQMMLKEKNT